MTDTVFTSAIGKHKCMFPPYHSTDRIRDTAWTFSKTLLPTNHTVFQFHLHGNCFQRQPQAERLMCMWIRGIQLWHYRSFCTCFTLLGAADNYLPNNLSHTLKQACWNKWHTFKMCLMLWGFFLFVKGGNVEHACACLCEAAVGKNQVKEFKNKANRDKQEPKSALWGHRKPRRPRKIHADIWGVSLQWWWWWCRLSQIKVWCNCYKRSVSPLGLLLEMKLSVRGISRIEHFWSFETFKKETKNPKHAWGYLSFKQKLEGREQRRKVVQGEQNKNIKKWFY